MLGRITYQGYSRAYWNNSSRQKHFRRQYSIKKSGSSRKYCTSKYKISAHIGNTRPLQKKNTLGQRTHEYVVTAGFKAAGTILILGCAYAFFRDEIHAIVSGFGDYSFVIVVKGFNDKEEEKDIIGDLLDGNCTLKFDLEPTFTPYS
jgi:hypothetical protein